MTETDEERDRRLCRENYAAQMESLGYDVDGNQKQNNKEIEKPKTEHMSNLISRKDAIDQIYELLCYIPSEYPVIHHGHWIRGRYWSSGIGMGETYGYYYNCSECGEEVKGDYTDCGDNYCRQCGAKMESEGES